MRRWRIGVRESRHIRRQVWLAGLKALQRPQLEGKRDSPIGLGAHRLQIRQQQVSEAQREGGWRFEDHSAVRNRYALAAEGDLANPAESEEWLGFASDKLLLNHHAGGDGGKGRIQPLGVAVNLVVALASRFLGDGFGIEQMHREVGRDHAHFDQRASLMPGLPFDGKRVPSLRAFLGENLIDNMPDVRDAAGLVEGIALILNQDGDIRAFGRGHCRSGFIEGLGLDRKVRRLPGFNGLLGEAKLYGWQGAECAEEQSTMGTER